MSIEDIINAKNSTKMRFLKTMSEKREYLGEYREKVLFALTKDQIIEDKIYSEVIDAIKKREIVSMKIARDIPFAKLKPYIKLAEEMNMRYELVDGAGYVGDIGLVGIVFDVVENLEESPIIRDVDQDFIDAGLSEKFSKSRGDRICGDCFEKLEDKLPHYIEEFEKINLLDRFFGKKCPICNK